MSDQLHSHALACAARMKFGSASGADTVKGFAVHRAPAPTERTVKQTNAMSPQQQSELVTGTIAQGEQRAMQQAGAGAASFHPSSVRPIIESLAHGLGENTPGLTSHETHHAGLPVELRPVEAENVAQALPESLE